MRFDMDGKIVYTDVNNISSVDEETANAYASEVYVSGKISGKKEEFRYRVQASKDGRGTNIVFLNVSSDRQSMLAVLLISSLIFVVGKRVIHLVPETADIEYIDRTKRHHKQHRDCNHRCDYELLL